MAVRTIEHINVDDHGVFINKPTDVNQERLEAVAGRCGIKFRNKQLNKTKFPEIFPSIVVDL